VAAEASPTGRRLLLAVVGIVAVGLAVMGAAIVSLERSLDRVDVTGLGEPPRGVSDDAGDEESLAEESAEPQEPPAEAITVLVLGSDARDVLTPEERRELGTGDALGERTESIALLRLDPEADTLRMLNVPRDTLLTRCDGSRGRVNAAYGIGEREGVGALSCVVRTLTEWGGVTIDHAVKVDFRGFVDIVDAVGGVPMTLEESLADERANLDLPAGCTRLDGAQALAFVRARSIDSDFGRIERQQRFVEELRTEIGELGILSDLPQLYRTASAMARAVELDSELDLVRIQQLARHHRTSLEAPVEGRSIPGRTVVTDGLAFLRVDAEDVNDAFRWLEHGGDRPGDAYDAAVGRPGGPAAGTTPPDAGSGAGDGAASGDATPDTETPDRARPRC
jgi:LCP family protein required for cell wall assembly